MALCSVPSSISPASQMCRFVLKDESLGASASPVAVGAGIMEAEENPWLLFHQSPVWSSFSICPC